MTSHQPQPRASLFPYRTVVYWDDVETPALWDQTQQLLIQAHIRHVDFFYIREHEIAHLDLPIVLPRIGRMGDMAAHLMARGIDCSISILPSLGWGHHLPHEPFEKYIGPDGQVSGVGACPLDPQFVTYLLDIAAAIAQTPVGHLGLDDDYQNNNHRPVSRGCFCPRHLAAFSQQEQRTWPRAELAAQLPTDPVFKSRWDRFRMQVLADLAQRVMQHARQSRPTLQSFIAVGGDVAQNPLPVMQALGADTWRPAMGKYDDSDRFTPVLAAWAGQCQRIDWPRALPTPSCLAEITSWPRNAFAKSWTTMMGQAAVACFLGFDAALFWSGQGRRDPGFSAALSTHRAWFDTLAQAVQDHPHELGIAVPRAAHEPLVIPPAMLALARMGFPLRLLPADAPPAGPALLTSAAGPHAAAWAQSSPALIDPSAITRMSPPQSQQLGLCVTPATQIPFSAELINDHPLNANAANFYSVSLTFLTPADHQRLTSPASALPLAHYVDARSQPIMPSLMLDHTPRWLLANYSAAAWPRLVSHHKAAQLRAALLAAFGAPLPVTAHGIDLFIFVRQGPHHRLVLALNGSHDPQPVQLTIDTPVRATHVADNLGQWRLVPATSCPTRGQSPLLPAHHWRLYRFEMS